DLPMARAPPANHRFTRLADVRYAGQVHGGTVPIPPGRLVDAAAVAGLAERFHRTHDRLYGFAQPDLPVELVNLRLEARVLTTAPEPAAAAPRRREPDGVRRAWFDGAFRDVPVRSVGSVPVDVRREGPALLAGSGTTIVIPPGFAFEVTAGGTTLMFDASRTRAEVLADLRDARLEAVR
ncbi:hypothetical protein ACFFNX_35865, partial [Actinoallomurus acaciae]